MCLHHNTHRYLIEHLTEHVHTKFSLCRRFLKFIKNIEGTPKIVWRNILSCQTRLPIYSRLQHSKKTVTLKIDRVNEISPKDLENKVYWAISEDQEGRVKMAKELMDLKVTKTMFDVVTMDDI